MNSETVSEKPSVKERAMEELVKFLIISAYLAICFCVLILYKSSIEGSTSSDYLNFGAAVVKALVLAKFILIGEAMKTGKRVQGPTLTHRIIMKSIAFLVLLIVFHIIEEVTIGLFHDKTVVQSLLEYWNQPWIAKLAPELLMLFIMIPMVTASEFEKMVGAEAMKKVFLGRDTD
ncbi:MAG TPA: hypothetical protein VJ984_14695 [Xanthomonadales bacterium]|nr:hypothetical protein [Xanthomonadales bacterium]